MKKLTITLLLAVAALLPAPAMAQAKKAKTPKKQSVENIDSLQNIADMAENGNADAQNAVGLWYYRGENFSRDYGKAVQWWLRAMKQQHPEAIGNLAQCYLSGHGVKVDSVRAAGLARRAIKLGSRSVLAGCTDKADNGDVWAAGVLAGIYKKGDGKVSRNSDLYHKYLGIVAESGDVDASIELGLALLNAGKDREAFKVFGAITGTGNPTACFWTGKMLLEGKGVKMDKAKGVDFLFRSAEAGMPMAKYYIGRCYSEGDGVSQDDAQAVKWYRTAAAEGNHYAQYALGHAMFEGKGCKPDMNQALHWLERAATRGHKVAFTKLINDTIPGSPFATYCRGMKLMQGGAYSEALAQFKLLEKTHKYEGKAMQGMIYCDAVYSKYNFKKGLNLIKDAAKNLNPMALYLLGTFCLEGTGMGRNIPEGVKNIIAAANLGNPQAQLALADLYFEGRGVENDYEQSAQYYALASQLLPLNEDARRRYASIYEQGMGRVKRDEAKAKEILSGKSVDLLPDMLRTVVVIAPKK